MNKKSWFFEWFEHRKDWIIIQLVSLILIVIARYIGFSLGWAIALFIIWFIFGIALLFNLGFRWFLINADS